MRLAALLPKVRLGPGALSAYRVVRMATVDGALALGHGSGTIAVGEPADFMLLDPDSGFARPTSWRDDPFGPIVYSFDRGNVAATYVGGILRHDRAAASGLKPPVSEIERAAARLSANQLAI
jgi:5-methylthioadenosine/S-adenosylhomocysteine deaminase